MDKSEYKTKIYHDGTLGTFIDRCSGCSSYFLGHEDDTWCGDCGILGIDPLNVQIGGDHYKRMIIQPAEYAQKNGLGFIEGCVVKYVSRYKTRAGKEDLEKAKHFIEMLIELEYGNGTK